MTHDHDASTTPRDCVEQSLVSLADSQTQDPIAALEHGLKALAVLSKQLEEARDIAIGLYADGDPQERVRLLAELTTEAPTWLTYYDGDGQLTLT